MAGSTARSKKRRPMSEINVVPYIDVMLVLLIIFMVTAPMMSQGVNVDLPETTSGPLTSQKEHLVITIDRENRVFINDFEVKVDQLGDKLARILAGRADREVYLKADKHIPYGIVVGVMAAIKEAGVEKLGMVTEPPPKDKERKGSKD